MPTFTVNQAIQKLLTDKEFYDGKIDGKIGPASFTAINKLITSYGIDHSDWNNVRKLTAAEQILYKEEKIEVGKLDGKVGPSVLHAREVYNAKLVTTWRDKAEEIAEIQPPKPQVKIKVVSNSVWPTYSNAMSFYGKPGTNQATCKLPFQMRLAWDKSAKLNSYSCHSKVRASMERVWQNVFDYYGYEKIKHLGLDLFGGCLNVRKMRGGSNWSVHAWGAAIDIDPERNALRTSWKNSQMSKPEYKKYHEFWYAEGFVNLGIERDYDSMHTEAIFHR